MDFSQLNYSPDQATTILQQISSGLLQKYPALTELLSAASNIQELSSIPITPYERMKYDYFGKDYVFKTIDDIETPETFNLPEITEQINNISDQLALTTLSAASAFQTQQEKAIQENNSDINNLSFYISEINIDKDLARKNIEFSEVIRSLTMQHIEQQPVETAKKILSHYVKLYK
jgi:hypothetical protein